MSFVVGSLTRCSSAVRGRTRQTIKSIKTIKPIKPIKTSLRLLGAAAILAIVVAEPGAMAQGLGAPTPATTRANVDHAVPGLPDAPIRFRHLTSDDGLSNDRVNAIFQDSLGFMWFGTEDGLNRYDGTAMRVFRPAAFDSTAITSTWPLRIVSAATGGFWIATSSGGVNRYDPRTETFSYPRSGNGAPQPSDDLFELIEARNGRLWVGTRYRGVFAYDPDDSKVTTFGIPPPEQDQAAGVVDAQVRRDGGVSELLRQQLSDAWVQALLEDRTGRIWVGTRTKGLVLIDPSSGEFSRLDVKGPEASVLRQGGVHALLQDTDGTVWIGTNDSGLLRYDVVSGELVRYRHDSRDVHSIGSNEIVSLLQDPDGDIWVGTREGLDRYDESTGRFVRLRHDPEDETSIPPGPVLSMLIDRSGIFWVGTVRGIGLFDWRNRPFALVQHSRSNPNSIEGNSIQSIYQDQDGLLWVGTHTGLNRMNLESGEIRRYLPDPTNPAALANAQVMLLTEDRDGNFWVGSRRGGLHLFDRNTGTVLRRFGGPDYAGGLENDTPWFMLEDDQGDVWITSGGRGCLSRMNPSDQTFTMYCHDPDDPNTPSHDIAHDIVQTSDGKLWLGTWGGGLDRLDPYTGVFDHFRHDQADESTISHDFILSMYRGEDDVLWLGTFGGGLDRFDTRTGEIKHYDTGNSDLPSDVVLAMEGDGDGDIWLSTYGGITRFSPDIELFRNYGVEDGLQSLEFTNNAKFRAPDGTLFFGGENGLNAWQPWRFRARGVTPRAVVTGVRIRGESIDDVAEYGVTAIPYLKDLELSHDQRDISISFAGLDFLSPSRTRYRFLLQGYDRSWQKVVGEPVATYTNLNPGSYLFNVQAANSEGVWSDNQATVRILIRPPWWRTTWAMLLFAAIVLGFAVSAYRYDRNRLQLKRRLELEVIEAKNLREVDRTKSRFFADVSHEFRTPLTLTLGPLEDIRAGRYGDVSPDLLDQIDLAHRNAGRVLELINQILDVSRVEAGKMKLHTRPVDLCSFAQEMLSSLRPLAERKRQSMTFECSGTDSVVFADQKLLRRIIGNLVSNAIKFTPDGGVITVSVGDDRDSAWVSISDSGPGIPEEDLAHIFDRFYRAQESKSWTQLGTGIGLSLSRELADLHGGSLTATSRVDEGSTFRLTLRKGREHLAADQIDLPEDGDAAWPDGQPPQFIESDVVPPRPASRDAGGSSSATDQTGVPSSATDQTTVLIVEDNHELRAFIAGHLRDTYRVIEAHDGVAGLREARASLPDLIISDVMMPEMDGLALCRALKTDPETDFIPLVLLTAKADHENRLEGLHERADDYITKPFRVDELLARVRNLIESRRRLREYFSSQGDGASRQIHVAAANVSSADERFLERIGAVVSAHIEDENFTVEQFAADVGLDRSQLYRRLQELVEMSPTDLIMKVRLDRAAELLAAKAGNVSEVAYAVGFKSVAHFSRRFKQQFGKTPTEFRSDR